MQPIYLTAFVGLAGAFSTLLGVLITSRMQMTNQKENNKLQLELVMEKAKQDTAARLKDTAVAQLAVAHKIVGHISRECSVDNIVIMRKASMSVEDFNTKYMFLCEKAEELLMIVDFHAPEASKSCREMNIQMQMFWGNFQNVLYFSESGKKVDSNNFFFNEAHEAARKIGENASIAKSELRKCFDKQIKN